ncbi:uncharacterized protein DUF4815 [Pseudaminobacter salicylatoxidans]|uniref:Uncharacterized protein DUF4815 n=1 Tax=Pseudaminobacter salicylatoxidans TaxID=93369 RepID=A0A316BYX2_PSESE|nr:uncharacterized protein DUF4815 [Pseudaminobacter salicylatoxidans]
MWRFFNRIYDHDRLIQLERLKSGIDAREPVAKKGMFIDPLVDDTYRDAGVPQTAAIGDGMMQLPIDVTFFQADIAAPLMLDWVEEVIVDQSLKTGCTKINPYQNFKPLPGALKLTPASDFWTESTTEWLSPQTQEFNRGVRTGSGPLETTSSETRLVDHRSQQAEFLRQINISFAASGFGAGEIVEKLTFDNVSVLPAGGLTANAGGVVSSTFKIPARVTAGTKTVRITGKGGSEATALFTGQGTIEIDVMRRVTTIERWTAGMTVVQRGVIQPGGAHGGDHSGSHGDSSSGTSAGGADPQAQNFMLPELRQLVGLDFHLCKIGNRAHHVLVHQVSVENGWPTVDVMAEAVVPMATTQLGWQQARFALPVTTPDDRDHSMVVKTDDGEHSISYAALGGFDASLQRKVTTHPYPIGPRLDSVNAKTWTPHQGEALSFRLVAAKYPVTTKTIPLGEFDLVDCSDIQVRAAVELPSAACSVVFEIERTNGTVWQLLPFQVMQLNEYITERVKLRAVLKGTAKLSPIVYAPIQLLAGKIATTATYVCRAFKFGNNVNLTSYIKVFLPGGTTVSMEYDKADGTWVEIPLTTTEQLNFPLWSERKHSKSALTATEGRLRITLTGSPAARPILGDLGAAIM